MIAVNIPNVKLIENDFYSEIFTHCHLRIRPQEIIEIRLPYRRIPANFKYFNFELCESLARKGLSVVHHNLNLKTSEIFFSFCVKNTNIEVLDDISMLTRIIGSNKITEIIPNTLFGRIY